MNLDSIRKEYEFAELRRRDLHNNPFHQFGEWLDIAVQNGIRHPTAMSVITCGEDGFPQSRIVLLKDYTEKGFIFFSSYKSEKGIAIAKNKAVGLHFFWPELERQIRISGYAEKVGTKISDEYFYSRPKRSQIAAIVSNQSREIASRKELELEFKAFLAKNNKIERPEFWGGYIVCPVTFEYWQGRENRLHDRFQYTINELGWKIKRLAP